MRPYDEATKILRERHREEFKEILKSLRKGKPIPGEVPLDHVDWSGV